MVDLREALDNKTEQTTSSAKFLSVNNLVKHFKLDDGLLKPKIVVKAVNNISFQIKEGETYGLVGESGCGKSTTGRMILRLLEATSGEVIYKGKNRIL